MNVRMNLKKLICTLSLIMLLAGIAACGNNNYGERGVSANGIDVEQLELVDSGYTIYEKQGEYFTSWAVKVKNPNKLFAADAPILKITVYDNAEKVVETWIVHIPATVIPKATIGYGNSEWDFETKVKDKQEIGKIEFEIESAKCFYPFDISDKYLDMEKFAFQNISFTKSKNGGYISGEFIDRNKYDENSFAEEEIVTVYVLYKDKKGNLVGGDEFYFEEEDSIEYKKDYIKYKFKINTFGDYVSKHYQMYIVPWYELGDPGC